MRLTIVNQFYAPDLAPTGHMAASLANHRAGLGDQVSVITSAGGYVPQSPIENKGAEAANPRVFRLWTPRAGKGSALARLADYCTFFALASLRMLLLPRQDIIISLTTPPFIAWTAVLHRVFHPSARIVLWNMDCYPEIAERTGVIHPGSVVSRFLRWLNRRLFGQLSLVVCLDKAMESLLRSSYDRLGGNLAWRVVSNWEPLSEFPADSNPPQWNPAEDLGLGQRFVILYLGNAGFGHSFETMMDAAEALGAEPISWLFVGGGSKWPWLAEEARRRGLKHVHLLPYVPKQMTPSVMAAADCALITMNAEAVGVVSPSKLHGNLAMGLPILYIGPGGGNVHEALEAFGAGVSLRPGDVAGVTTFVRHLISDPSERNRFSQRARQAFEARYADSVGLPLFDVALERIRSELP
jgi:colanic acid biosynthesis glycosyl transferase WcaI